MGLGWGMNAQNCSPAHRPNTNFWTGKFYEFRRGSYITSKLEGNMLENLCIILFSNLVVLAGRILTEYFP